MNILCIKTIGGSMWPLIKSGHYVWIKKDVKKFYPGDVVLYELDNQKFIHRIKKITGDYAIITDDTGVIDEQLVPFKNIIGRQVTFLNNIFGLIYNYLIFYAFFIKNKIIKKFL